MRRIILLSICLIPTIASWWPFPPRAPRLFSKATFEPCPLRVALYNLNQVPVTSTPLAAEREVRRPFAPRGISFVIHSFSFHPAIEPPSASPVVASPVPFARLIGFRRGALLHSGLQRFHQPRQLRHRLPGDRVSCPHASPRAVELAPAQAQPDFD